MVNPVPPSATVAASRVRSKSTRTVDVVAGRVHEVPGDPGSGNQAGAGPEEGR
jgi:hypothetical protein